MGYYTRYTLEVRGDGYFYKKFMDEGFDEPFGTYEVSPADLVHNNCDSMKWYDYNKDMQELSESWPNVLFILSGEGEESGDIWRAYYMNGHEERVQAEIVFREPDLSKFPKIDESHLKELEEKRAAIQAQIAELEATLDTLKP